jgi:hypothetical protein
MSKSQKIYTDPDGNPVPAKYVSAYDKARDRITRKIYDLWGAEEQRLTQLRAQTERLIDEVRQAAAKEAGVKLGGAKGYLQFRSFDGRIIVRFENVAQVDFDERLSLAQQLIGEAIDDMAGDTSKNAKLAGLRKIAEAAFKPRGKNGKLDRQRVRDIANVQVNHPKWRKAAELIRECETITGHKAYVRVAKRLAPEAPPIPIVLDITKV